MLKSLVDWEKLRTDSVKHGNIVQSLEDEVLARETPSSDESKKEDVTSQFEKAKAHKSTMEAAISEVYKDDICLLNIQEEKKKLNWSFFVHFYFWRITFNLKFKVVLIFWMMPISWFLLPFFLYLKWGCTSHEITLPAWSGIWICQSTIQMFQITCSWFSILAPNCYALILSKVKRLLKHRRSLPKRPAKIENMVLLSSWFTYIGINMYICVCILLHERVYISVCT